MLRHSVGICAGSNCCIAALLAQNNAELEQHRIADHILSYAAQHGLAQLSTAHYGMAWHNRRTAQHSTASNSTAWHNTAQE